MTNYTRSFLTAVKMAFPKDKDLHQKIELKESVNEFLIKNFEDWLINFPARVVYATKDASDAAAIQELRREAHELDALRMACRMLNTGEAYVDGKVL